MKKQQQDCLLAWRSRTSHHSLEGWLHCHILIGLVRRVLPLGLYSKVHAALGDMKRGWWTFLCLKETVDDQYDDEVELAIQS